MRAIFYPFENHAAGDLIQITGDSVHHLTVARVRENEKILLLNGKGQRLLGIIQAFSKKSVDIKIAESENCKPSHELSLAIAMPKKEAFEDILKMAVELGVTEIFPLTSDYSQHEFSPNDRIQRILESALVQSNNPFFPHIHPEQILNGFLSSHTGSIAFFNSKTSDPEKVQESETKKTILIGPEGGFSAQEIATILKYPKTLEIHLPTPILRASTAVAASIGFLLSSSVTAKTH
ncbi:MAG: 16S rRNA (uracil(1498)-N(3))-methyltransferase [Bacteriovorax sp.]|nr:16S rRNA (uracil(1498)-N(3))-methyltransferase [Bacteriovorax sp.]